MRRCLRLVPILVLATLAACSGSRPKPVPPGYTPLPAHKGEVGPNDILFRAIGLVGTPYRWGGNTPQSGFDCSGLIVFVFREVAGIPLPRTVQDIYAVDLADVRRDRLQGGDLVFFHTSGSGVSHIGIYVGQDRFVHAPNEGGTVRLDYLSNPYWDQHYSDARRVPL
ncbi:MAG TPA: C40 family peptidase [Rudaea sp.]|jgi:cell wall-associated NlpC family hydrolase|uniref:C40 family peptidase n=1 Tax=Rudaea sp. TaxID=2136325 RepID=UPI002F938573